MYVGEEGIGWRKLILQEDIKREEVPVFGSLSPTQVSQIEFWTPGFSLAHPQYL